MGCPELDCQRHMSSDSNLRKHYNNVHRKLFSCTYCNNTFPKRRQLSAHIFSHTGVPPFRCDRCDIGCASEYELKRHQRGHKTHTCTVTGCNLTFDLWTQLRKHTKLEHPLQFACLKCNKVFKTKHNLKLHIEIHEDPDKREVLTCPHDNCPRLESLLIYSSSSSLILTRLSLASFQTICLKVLFSQKKLDTPHTVEPFRKITRMQTSRLWEETLHKAASTNRNKISLLDYYKKSEGLGYLSNTWYVRQNYLGVEAVRPMTQTSRPPVSSSGAGAEITQKLQDHMKLHNPYGPLPRRRNQQTKERKKRRDAGKHKRSVAVKLSGLVVPYEVEKQFLHGEDVNNTVMSDAIKVSSLEKQEIPDSLSSLQKSDHLLKKRKCPFETDTIVCKRRLVNSEKALYENTHANLSSEKDKTHEESDGNSKIGEESDEYIDITESERDIDIRQESDMNAKIRNNLESDIEIIQSERNTDLHQGSDMHAKIVKESEQAIEIKESERCIDLVKEAQEYIEMDESEKDFNTYQESDTNTKMTEKSEEDNDRNESESENDAHEESDEYIDVVGVEEEMVIKVNNTDKEYKAEEDSDEDSEIDIESKENSEINTDSEDDSELEEDSEENEVAEEYITFNEIEKTEYNIKTGNAPKYNLIGDKMIEASKEHKMEIDVDLSDFNVEENEGKEMIGESQHKHKINTDAALLTGGIEINEGLNENVAICEEFEDVNEIKEESNENVDICKKDFEINEESDEYIDVGIEDEVNIIVEVTEKDNKLEEESDDITVEEGSDYDAIEDDVDKIEEEYGKHNKLEEETKINKCVEKESKDKNEVDQLVKETETTNSIGINQAPNFGCDFKEDELKERFMINEQIKTQIGPDEELKNGSAFHKQGEIDTMKKNEDKEETTTKKIIKKGTDEDKPGKMMEGGMQSTNVKKMEDISPTNLKNFIATMLRVMEHLFPLINEGISENYEMETDENRIEETVKGMPEEINSHIISADENKTSIQVKTASLSCDNVPLKDYTPVLACNETILESLVNLKLLSSRKETEDEDEDINVEVFSGDSDDEDVWKCCNCGKSFRNRKHLEKHMFNHVYELHTQYNNKQYKGNVKRHDLVPNKQQIVKQFSKKNTFHSDFRQGFKSREKIEQQRLPNNEELHTHLICEQSFKQEIDLENHTLDHTEVKPYKCLYCGKYFLQHSALVDHLALHNKQTMYHCAECGKEFSKEFNLMRHKLTHTEKMSHGHINIHRIQELYKCSICGENFKENRDLLIHETVHTNDQLLTCPICRQSFNSKVSFESHFVTHKREKPFKCLTCGVSFMLNASLIRHSTIHNGQAYKCTDCGKLVRSKSALKRHIETHVPEKAFKCALCDLQFRTKEHLLRHNDIHTNYRPFECADCDISDQASYTVKEGIHCTQMQTNSSSSELMSDNWVTKEVEGKHTNPCLVATKTLKAKGFPNKKKHANEKCENIQCSASSSILKCPTCCKVFKHKVGLKKHVSMHSFNESQDECVKDQNIVLKDLVVNNSLDRGSSGRKSMPTKSRHTLGGIALNENKCLICGKCFKAKRVLQSHMQTHTEGRIYMCNECGKSFNVKSIWQSHIQTHTEGRIYTYNECGKIFNVKRALEIHFQTHTGDRPYKCDKCEKTFGFKSHLMRHMLIHNRQKPYKCAECGYHSRVKWNLKVHMENHIGQKEKVWNCPECNESFESFAGLTSRKSLHRVKEPHKCVKCGHFFKSTRALLDHHSRVHISRSFHCSICDKNFKMKYHLNRHLLLHSKKKLFKKMPKEGKLVECSECGKSFKQMGALRKHMAHHDLKPYLCVLCGKYFRTEMNLSGHVLTHGQSNECPICRKCFKRKAYLQKHVLLHSNNKMYECTVCGKRFHQKSYLAKHLLAISCELSVSTKEAMELLYFLEVENDNPRSFTQHDNINISSNNQWFKSHLIIPEASGIPLDNIQNMVLNMIN
uniref:C2H2-type domain-containing protein n=1 Tax=Timema douglasi TaxID=61478 RepID=A0A7R8VLK5_TIMDO|nr:unnamed protein product [Timema douglasi]